MDEGKTIALWNARVFIRLKGKDETESPEASLG